MVRTSLPGQVLLWLTGHVGDIRAADTFRGTEYMKYNDGPDEPEHGAHAVELSASAMTSPPIHCLTNLKSTV